MLSSSNYTDPRGKYELCEEIHVLYMIDQEFGFMLCSLQLKCCEGIYYKQSMGTLLEVLFWYGRGIFNWLNKSLIASICNILISTIVSQNQLYTFGIRWYQAHSASVLWESVLFLILVEYNFLWSHQIHDILGHMYDIGRRTYFFWGQVN